MVTQADIVAAVKSAIEKKYPAEIVYENIVPNRFERPSFFVESTGISLTASTTETVTFRSSVRVTCFENVDEYHNSQLASLGIRQLAVMGLFAPLYIRVGSRALDVVKLTGTPGGADWTDVTVELEWDEDIAAFQDIKELPTMENLSMKLEGTT